MRVPKDQHKYVPITCRDRGFDNGGRSLMLVDNHGESKPDIAPTNSSSLGLEPGRIQNDEVDDRICRICLEGEQACSDLIAPCLCRGGSKWVHRFCLDTWRTNQEDRAFSKCTECRFYYRYEMTSNKSEARWRRAKYCLFVTRDTFFGLMLVQLVIALLAFMIYFIDGRGSMDILDGFGCNCTNTTIGGGEDGHDDTGLDSEDNGFWCHHVLSLYYATGLIALLVVLGVLGCTVFCTSGCSVSRAMAFEPCTEVSTTTASGDIETRGTHVYSGQENSKVDIAPSPPIKQQIANEKDEEPTTPLEEALPSREVSVNNGTTCTFDCYHCPTGSSRGGVDLDCCCCCCNSGNDCSCCCCCNSGNDCNVDGDGGDCAGICFFIVVITIGILATVGMFVGIVMSVVLFQRTTQRHVHHLQKKRLVAEFRVLDLDGYDVPLLGTDHKDGEAHLSGRMMFVAPSEEDNSDGACSPPSLHNDDVVYLKKLGLME